MNLLLDTHAYLWGSLFPKKLSRDAARAIARAQSQPGQLYISAATLVECHAIFQKAEISASEYQGLLQAAIDESAWNLMEAKVKVIPVDMEVASGVAAVPVALADPGDRMIISTALCRKLPVVSKDGKFPLVHGLKVIW